MSTQKGPANPVIVICGATGTGKSALAIALAKRYNGEIINADAVQMYKGLPIVTNKVPDHERGDVPHHLLDFIDLRERTWTAHDFAKEGSRLINDIRSRGKLPIVVGGTGYYMHGLLFETALLHDAEEDISEEANVDGDGTVASADVGEQAAPLEMLNRTTEELYTYLVEVDPEMAKRWHPRDRRKIRRSLEIFLKTGKKASDMYREQRAFPRNSVLSMRFDALVFWLDAEDTLLKERLDARVESMVQKGLLEEVQQMRKLDDDITRSGAVLDKTYGVWIALGYKELEPWLNMREDTEIANSVRERTLREGIESVKAGTRRYAKRQNRYMRHRLAKDIGAASALEKLFLLDTSKLEMWHDTVEVPAETITKCFMAGLPLPEPASLSTLAQQTFERISTAEDAMKSRFMRHCETCDKALMTESEWATHMKSRSHKKAVEAQRKKAVHASEEVLIGEVDDAK